VVTPAPDPAAVVHDVGRDAHDAVQDTHDAVLDAQEAVQDAGPGPVADPPSAPAEPAEPADAAHDPAPVPDLDALEAERAGLDPTNPFDADRIDELDLRIEHATHAAPVAAETATPLAATAPTVDPHALPDAFDDIAGSPSAEAIDDPLAVGPPLAAAVLGADDLPDLDDDVLGVAALSASPVADLAALDVATELPAVADLPDLPQVAVLPEADLATVPDLGELPALDVDDALFAPDLDVDVDAVDDDDGGLDLSTPDL
jgi:hypothetical protein